MEKILMSDLYETVPLSKVVKINSGIALPKIFKDIENTKGEYQFFKVAQMNNDTKIMKGAELNFTESQSIEFKIKLFPKGSVLIPKRGGAILTNKKRLLTENASYDSNIMGLKADNKVLTDEFLVVYMDSINLSDYIDTSTIPQINNKHIEMMKIPLPPLSEQQRIVSKLDKLFEKIDKSIALHQKNRDEADMFMGSVLNDVFGELEGKYEKIDFNSVCNKITDGSHNPPKGIENSEYLMLSSKNVIDNTINFKNPRYLKEEDFIKENKRTDVMVGDVLLTIVGTIGRTAVVETDKKFVLQRSVAVLKPKNDLLDSYFLMYSLRKNLDILVGGAKGAAQKGIYLKSIKQLEIVNVPLNIQQKVVKYLDEVSQNLEKIKSVQKEKMDSLISLKASILDRAFRGEL
ncbi:MAG: restriction endonuclease subunit S [Campylobacterota bacterium]|nr:restriction endonuclease subunit S [Campylobacterota bacterium]